MFAISLGTIGRFLIPLLLNPATALPTIAVLTVGSIACATIAHNNPAAFTKVNAVIDHTMASLHRGVENTLNWPTKLASEGKEKRDNPPYSGADLGNDPKQEPEKFKWRGRGERGSKRGAYYNEETGESLHPDLDHPPPIKPHWDYEGPNGEKARLNTDGTFEWK